jgi:hypothetical protein
MTRNRRKTVTYIAIAVLSPLLFTAPARAEDSKPPKPRVLHGIAGFARPATSNPSLGDEEELSRVQDAALAFSALGAYYDSGKSEYVVVAPSEGPGSELKAEDFAYLALPLRVERSSFTQQQISGVAGDIGDRSWHPDAGEFTYTSFFDLERGKTVLDSDAPPDVVAPLLEQHAGAIDYQQSPIDPVAQNSVRQTSVVGCAAGAVACRYNDPMPHWGGAALVRRTSFDNNHSAPLECTSGFSVRTHNTHSIPGVDLTNDWMLTAGRCGEPTIRDGELYNWNPNPSGVTFYGSVFQKAPYPDRDMELIGNFSFPYAWDGVIYDGAGSSDSGILVGQTSLARDPISRIQNYCYSGAATFQQCGLKLYTNFAQYCRKGLRCTENLSAYRPVDVNAPLPALPGDTGAAMYLRTECDDGTYAWPCAAIRGMYVVSSERFMLAVKWTTIAAGGPFTGIDGATGNFDAITPISIFNPPD